MQFFCKGMLIDSHIHVGQFYDYYFAPSYIHKLMEQLNIQYYAVSSTTMCEENYPKVIDEIHELIELDGSKVLPVMWITPEGLKGNIAWFLDSDIKWRCIKVHPALHDAWVSDVSLFNEVSEIASEMNVPLMIHTGIDDCCKSSIACGIIKKYSHVEFILAHGRPILETIELMQACPNVWMDTAFVSINDIEQFLDKDLSSKMLWGTDMCIPKYFYPEENLIDYYNRKLNGFKAICSKEEFEQVTYKNAMKLFNIK